MKKVLLSLFLALVLIIFWALPIYAATTQDITVTATPTYIALTNDTATWEIGTVTASTTYWWTANSSAPAEPFVDGGMKAILTNTGSVSENFNIHGHNFTGGAGWTLDSNTSEDHVVLKAGITGMANEAAMVTLTLNDQELKHDLASAAHVHWCMEFKTGTFSEGTAKSSTVTVTAVQHT